jgi:hypothetical protein
MQASWEIASSYYLGSNCSYKRLVARGQHSTSVMSNPHPTAVPMQPLPSLASHAPAQPPLNSASASSPVTPSTSRLHSQPYYVAITILQTLAALAVAAFAVVIAGWNSRPSWAWSYLCWYFFALGGLQLFSVWFAVLSAAKQSKGFLIVCLFFFTIGTLAVIVTGLLMLIPAFRSSFLSACFTPFVSGEYVLWMATFELQYCVTSTSSASDFGHWAPWSLALCGAFIQLPWIVYIFSHISNVKAPENAGPLAFNKLPQLDPSIPITNAQATSVVKDTSGGCGILFAPTNQSGTLQVQHCFAKTH